MAVAQKRPQTQHQDIWTLLGAGLKLIDIIGTIFDMGWVRPSPLV